MYRQLSSPKGGAGHGYGKSAAIYTADVTELRGADIAPNWTSAAGALEGILDYLGMPLPRHAIMGLTGHAWHLCLATRDNVAALPSGPVDLDWDAMVRRYARTGIAWERFGATLRPGDDWSERREAAVTWAIGHINAGRPLIGWDFHLHEHAVVWGYDAGRRVFLVDDVISAEAGSSYPWDDWPSPLGLIELFAPVGEVESDAIDVARGALETALECFAGRDGPADGQPRGTTALERWAGVFEGEGEVDRAGNAYTLAVLQAARLDGVAFLEDLAVALPDLLPALGAATLAIREETKALSPLLTLFPFPTGGHGNVSNAGLRRGAAMALRRAAQHEHAARAAIAEALTLFAE